MDYPYLIFYIILILLSFLYWRTKKIKYASWAFVVTFIFFGCRAPVVGADTWNYVRYMTGERSFYNDDPRPLEPLFIVYRDIVCSLTSSRFLVMIINTIVSCAPLYYITKKYSFNPPLTILFFCFLGGLDIYFCGLRQIIALAVLYIALLYWIQHEGHFISKTLLLVCCIVVAYFFHTTAVLYALIIVAALIPFSIPRVLYIILIAGSALFGIVLEKINALDIFSAVLDVDFSAIDRVSGYMENNEFNEDGAIKFILRLPMCALISYICMDKSRLAHPFSKIFFVEVLIFNFLWSVPMIHRICYPLSIFGAVVFSWCIDNETNKTVARKYSNLIIVLIIAFFLRSAIITLANWDINAAGRMHPYYFIFQDYSDHPSITRF